MVDELGKKLLEQLSVAVDSYFDRNDCSFIEYKGQKLYGSMTDGNYEEVNVVDDEMNIVATYKIMLEKV